MATIPAFVCAAVYLALAALIVLQARRSRTGLLLAAASGITALWAAATAALAHPLDGAAGVLDLLRSLAWYGFVLHLYRRALPADAGDRNLFTTLGLIFLAASATAVLAGAADAGGIVSLVSAGLLLRLGLAIGLLLLLENLYRSTATELRWHLGLACIALGALAAYDLVLCADAVLYRRASPVLLQGRAVAAILVAPLLALAAARNRGWKIDIHVSRTAAFHSATMVASGIFLLALAAAGELARRLGGGPGGWADVTEISLVFAGVLTVAVLLTSGSARARLRRGLVDHFFTHRFDYRREWLRCIEILSDTGPYATRGATLGATLGATPLAARMIRALADPVDSPAGLLFTRVPGQPGLVWAGGWNHAPLPPLPADHPLLAAMAPDSNESDSNESDSSAPDGAPDSAIVLTAALLDAEPTQALAAWLAIPLRHAGTLAGCILLAPPRAPFRLDREVFDLLRILAREVATHLAEQQATRALVETHALREYGERFAFVAHDIKNVSSQLSLLLSNAETHLANPAFQADMLATVRASVAKIGALIRRLQPGCAPPPDPDLPAADPAALLQAAAARPTGGARVLLDLGATGLVVPMAAAALEAAIVHLLDNAAAAAGPAGTVRLALRRDAGRAVIDIADDGPGMTADFIRDSLFRPFATTRPGGSGIGAFQARELLRAAGGDLAVLSQPGAGTTLRISLPIRITEAIA